MKKSDLVIGTRVARKLDSDVTGQDLYLDPGAIAAEPVKDPLTGDLKVYVKWDATYLNPSPSEVLVSDIDLEEKVQAKATKLEEEFAAYEKQVVAKMKEAGKLIREANKLAKKAGLDGLNDMYEATGPLYDAMDDAGWRTSSFNC